MMKKPRTWTRNRPDRRTHSFRPKRPVMDVLIQQTTPVFESFFIEEPRLVFAGAGLSIDPKEGLERFGPYEADKGAKPVIR